MLSLRLTVNISEVGVGVVTEVGKGAKGRQRDKYALLLVYLLICKGLGIVEKISFRLNATAPAVISPSSRVSLQCYSWTYESSALKLMFE